MPCSNVLQTIWDARNLRWIENQNANFASAENLKPEKTDELEGNMNVWHGGRHMHAHYLTGDGNWEETEPAESSMIACSLVG